MEYRKMLEYHRSVKADVTLAVKREKPEELSQFGVVLTHGDGQIHGFQEKPKEPRSDLVNLGIYVFTTEVLIDALMQDRSVPGSEHDFGKNVIPTLVGKSRVMAYPFDGYAYLESPQMPNNARNKDSFILISAGPDRTYGTRDDIVNFGSVGE
jgi:glucose-1-phosphate adenylyltransferase